MMKQPEVIMASKAKDPKLWFYRLSKLMKFTLWLLKSRSSADDKCLDSIDKYLHFIDQYTQRSEEGTSINHEESSKLWKSMIEGGLYLVMRRVASQSTELAGKPDSRRGLILEILRRSLDVHPHEINGLFPVCYLFAQFFHDPVNSNLESWYFLGLLELEPEQLEPRNLLKGFTNLQKSLRNSPISMVFANFVDGSESQKLKVTIDNSINPLKDQKNMIWLCYLFLKAISPRIDQFNEDAKIDYINVISTLIAPADYITSLSLIQASNENIEDQSDSDPSEECFAGSVLFSKLTQYHEETHDVINKIIEYINGLSHINSLKPIIFNTSDEIQSRVQSAIVQICNLMLSHEYLAIFNCRLLYTIAFSKEFSRSLWRSIVTATRDTIYGARIPIYQLICKGNDIGHELWRSILPKLKLFCCLCSYLLPTLGDDEFYTMNQAQFSLEDAVEDDVQMLNVQDVEHSTTNANHRSSSGSNNHESHGLKTNSDLEERFQSSSNSSSAGLGGFYVDRELVGISAILRDMCIGLIEIIYQGNKHQGPAPASINGQTSSAPLQISSSISRFPGEDSHLLIFEIKSCFQALVRLVCQLHARDSRKQFCPTGHWICPSVLIPANKAVDFQLVTSQQGRLMNQLTKYEQPHQERLAGISSEIKTVLILQEIPFVISFHDRVQIFHQLLAKERHIHQPDGYHFGLAGSAISVQIRRNYIYEDAFEELSFDNEPNMKLPLKVSLINAVGAEEAGIDGGGLTKEFLSELLKTGFDPMRGFFKYTKDHFLYPNPTANVLFANSPEGYEVHFEFLGRMLGKAIFEKIMVELPLAGFFLAKLLAVKHSSDVDLHNLESLDPVLYKNLVYLKNYKGDVADLDLDFTISNNDLGEHEMVELKPGGSKIPVTRENKIEYVHLVADYRLNKQIRVQCAAFKRGLAQLIDLDWLRMFDPKELQILISGAPTVIDVADWRRHTVYGNGYTDSSEAVKTFWTVVKQLDESQKRKLLKFATSCSLPPLLGFKDLVPQFSIAPTDETRLPTASTCMNLLKLPECQDEQTMRSKLLYAIESNSGFELS